MGKGEEHVRLGCVADVTRALCDRVGVEIIDSIHVSPVLSQLRDLAPYGSRIQEFNLERLSVAEPWGLDIRGHDLAAVDPNSIAAFASDTFVIELFHHHSRPIAGALD